MNVSASSLWQAGKLAVVVPIVLVLVVLMASRDAALVRADSAEIIISKSASTPTPTLPVLMVPGDSPVTLYVWAKNINDPLGVGAYQVDASFNGWIVDVDTMTIPSPNWLFVTTGRSGTCLEDPPEITVDSQTLQGRAWFGCHTVGPPPPAGPTTDGVIASFTVQPGPFELHTQTSINFSANSFLKDTGEVIGQTVVDPMFIPTTVSNLTVTIARCGDIHPNNVGDGLVTISDILDEALKFGKSYTQPGWMDIWDMDDDQYVTISDVLIVAQQFSRACTLSG